MQNDEIDPGPAKAGVDFNLSEPPKKRTHTIHGKVEVSDIEERRLPSGLLASAQSNLLGVDKGQEDQESG